MKNVKKHLSVILLVTAILAFFALTYQKKEVIGKQYLQINNTTVLVEVARTPAEREKGLSGRTSLPENSGMLFVFDEPKHWSFWMVDMNFGLDFIWIKGTTVVEINEKVPPPALTNNSPTILTPASEVDYVLEVNQGWIDKNKIKVGDHVTFHL